MTREEAKRFWLIRYENAKDFSDPHWEAQERREHREYVEALRWVIEALQDRPTGEWIEKYNGNGWNDFWDYTCSNCGKKYERADAVLYHANYCPNCGAKMTREEKSNEDNGFE